MKHIDMTEVKISIADLVGGIKTVYNDLNDIYEDYECIGQREVIIDGKYALIPLFEGIKYSSFMVSRGEYYLVYVVNY